LIFIYCNLFSSHLLRICCFLERPKTSLHLVINNYYYPYCYQLFQMYIFYLIFILNFGFLHLFLYY